MRNKRKFIQLWGKHFESEWEKKKESKQHENIRNGLLNRLKKAENCFFFLIIFGVFSFIYLFLFIDFNFVLDKDFYLQKRTYFPYREDATLAHDPSKYGLLPGFLTSLFRFWYEDFFYFEFILLLMVFFIFLFASSNLLSLWQLIILFHLFIHGAIFLFVKFIFFFFSCPWTALTQYLLIFPLFCYPEKLCCCFLHVFPSHLCDSSTWLSIYFTSNYSVHLMKIFILLVTFILFFIYSFWSKFTYNPSYISILLFSLFSVCLLISSNHFMALYISLELVSFSLYVLIGHDQTNLYAIESALKYFILNAISSCFLLISFIIIFYNCGSLELKVLYSPELWSNMSFNSQKSFVFANTIILIIFFFKLACAPLHFWSIDVYEGSSWFTMFYMLIIIKSGYFFTYLRLLTFISKLMDFSNLIWIFAFSSIIIGSFSILRQKRIKRFIAYSSVTNMGYILLLSFLNVELSVIYFCSYAILNILFFYFLTLRFSSWGYNLSSGGVAGSRSLIYLTSFCKIGHNEINKSSSSLFFFIGVLFLLGSIPPSPLFFAKCCLINLLWGASFTGTLMVVVLSSLITIFYYLRLVHLIITGVKVKY